MLDSRIEVLFTGRKDGVLPYANGQCDCACACPDSSFTYQSRLRMPYSFRYAMKSEYIEQQSLPKDYFVLFNTQCGTEVVVMNAPARCLWSESTLFDIDKHVKENVELKIERLLTAGLLRPIINKWPTPKEQVSQLLTVWLHITNACNLHCDYCYVDKSSSCMDNQTGTSAVDTVIRIALCKGYKQIKLKFAGGEPTLVLPSVLAIHDYAVAQGMRNGIEVQSVILSNGVNFDDGLISKLKARNICVMISLDGVGRFHDIQRKFADGSGSFEYIDKTIEKLIAADTRPMLSITISNRNIPGLVAVTQYALERGLPFSYNFFREHPRAESVSSLRVQNEQLVAAFLQSFEVIAGYPPDYSLMGTMIDCSCFSYPHHQACSAGESYIAIDTQGNIAKCPMLLDSPVTNIYAEDPLGDLRDDRTTLQQLDVDEKGECRKCKWRYRCAGGCPLLTYRTTGRYDAKSPYCEVYKAVFPELIRLEGLRIMKKAGVL